MAKNGNYTEIYPNGTRVYEHRVVAENILGRQLNESEVVHHIDGNGRNNNPDNLVIFHSNGDHARFHKQKNKSIVKLEDGTSITNKSIVEELPNICPVCGKRTKRIYCSRLCMGIGERKIKHPATEEILKLLETKSYCEIGEIYGVTDNAIRKWLRREGIDPPRVHHSPRVFNRVNRKGIASKLRKTRGLDEGWCNSCKQFRPISEFWKNKSRFSGLTNQCKDCIRKKRTIVNPGVDETVRYT